MATATMFHQTFLLMSVEHAVAEVRMKQKIDETVMLAQYTVDVLL